jgi:hypothetical protein
VNRHSNMIVKSRAEPTKRLAGEPLGLVGLGSGPTWSTCHIQPCGADDFDIGQLHFVIS